ncbi:MAG: NlpC/P60 family protein [Actinobacteria bacterium]|nr:NlpC/P60 family protein [Actinomycetota bacterium]
MTPRHRRRLGVLVGIALLTPLAAPTWAGGDPVDDKKAEAARIQNQLDAQGEKVSIAAERYNRAQIRLAELQSNLEKTELDLKRSNERFKQVRSRLTKVAVVAYMHGGSNATISSLARSQDHTQMLVRRQYLQVAAGDQRAVLGELRSAREDLTEIRVKLTDEEKDAKEANTEAAALRRAAVAAEEDQRAILGRVQGELAGLVAEEADRRAREQAAREPAPAPPSEQAAALAPGPSGAGSPRASEPLAESPGVQTATLGPVTAAPPPSSGAAAAVAEAERQIGKPYVYGGSGPDSFDCSGLTAWAWAAAGVHLSHSAYTQWFETTRVPIDEVQPGDLLFFGNDGVESIHHNAIYVGGGQMIEASQTGVPVRYRGWRAGDLVGAGRPG